MTSSKTVVLFIFHDHCHDDPKEKFKTWEVLEYRLGQHDKHRYGYTIVTWLGRDQENSMSLPVIAGASKDLWYQVHY